MSLILVLNDEEAKALDTILSALEDARVGPDEVDWTPDVRLVRDRLDAAIADREGEQCR